MIIVGLGNPGPKYAHHRHNIGSVFVDSLLSPTDSWHDDARTRSQTIEHDGTTYLRSLTYMNESGIAVGSYMKKHFLSPTSLVVVHDDLDFPVGQWKLSLGKGPPLHGGLLSIEEHLKTKEFWRLRIGVDARDPENRIPGIDYVLQNFVGDELARISREFPAMNEALDELRKRG